MKKIAITTFFAGVIVVATHAQDVIVTTKAEKIEAKVTEIDIDVVRYKQYDFQDGPTFIIKKLDIDFIVYQNGQVVVFEQQKLIEELQKRLSELEEKKGGE